jgi:ribulose-phosphate 3-epimerase
MIEQPEAYFVAFANPGSDSIIVHQEVSPHLIRTVQLIRRLSKKSVALYPSTPVIILDEIIEELDFEVAGVSFTTTTAGRSLIFASFCCRLSTRCLLLLAKST